MSNSNLKILYEDDHIIVVNKPAWQLSVPGKDKKLISTVDCLEAYLNTQALVVHRLDCATSGVMVFAKTKEAQRHLHHSFRIRRVSKIYHAVLCSQPSQTQGTVNLPLMTDWPVRPKQKVDFIEGKDALTSWQITQQPLPPELQDAHQSASTSFTFVELRPKTGRTHQLRLHMAAIGHPILGDRLYAHESYHRQPDMSAPFKRLYLHASHIFFQHPHTGRSVSFAARTAFL
jgi:tRNA pseudouridine32 synthase/23S rRNA pseudouridine746 synthase